MPVLEEPAVPPLGRFEPMPCGARGMSTPRLGRVVERALAVLQDAAGRVVGLIGRFVAFPVAGLSRVSVGILGAGGILPWAERRSLQTGPTVLASIVFGMADQLLQGPSRADRADPAESGLDHRAADHQGRQDPRRGERDGPQR